MWIDSILPADASGTLADLYKRIAGARGGVADIHQAQSLNPRANGCEYCVAHHEAALRQVGEESSLPGWVPEWAGRLAREPEGASAEDIARLRQAGLSDRAILDAVLTVAYFSYVNRLVLALGLALEPGFEATCRPAIDAAGDKP